MFKTLIIALILALMLSGIATAQKPVAQLPRVYIDTTWNPPVGGTTWAAHTAAQLSSALTVAVPGDVIVLDAGTIYSGYFRLPAKSNPNKKWIYIESSAYSSLPAPGTRVSPANAANMPKIVTPGATSAVQLNDGSNHWRFAGIEIYSASTYAPPGYTPGAKYGYALVSDYGNPPVTLPDSIVFDRCYIHGDATHDVQEGLQGNASNFAVVDSYISDIHMAGTDTQAVAAYYTPGPIKLVNNHLEAAGENVMFGGAGGANNPYIPSDIEMRNNYLYKPLSWLAVGVTIPPNAKWVEKNSLEFKSAQRVLVDSNVIENTWAAGQFGFAVLFTIRTSQSGNIAVVHDITITNNVLKNVLSGFTLAALDDMCHYLTNYPNCTNPGDTARINISNNLVTFMDPTLPGQTRNILFQPSQGWDRIHGTRGITHDVVFQHNTAISSSVAPAKWSIYWSLSAGQCVVGCAAQISNNVWILDNAMVRQPTGDSGQTLAQYMGAPTTTPYDLTQRFYGNAMYVPLTCPPEISPLEM